MALITMIPKVVAKAAAVINFVAWIFTALKIATQ